MCAAPALHCCRSGELPVVCPLSAQPPVKQFIKTPGGIDQYPCEINYIPGHNPDLVLRTGGEETARVDLTQYKTQEELHGLLASQGIPRSVAMPQATEQTAPEVRSEL